MACQACKPNNPQPAPRIRLRSENIRRPRSPAPLSAEPDAPTPLKTGQHFRIASQRRSKQLMPLSGRISAGNEIPPFIGANRRPISKYPYDWLPSAARRLFIA